MGPNDHLTIRGYRVRARIAEGETTETLWIADAIPPKRLSGPARRERNAQDGLAISAVPPGSGWGGVPAIDCKPQAPEMPPAPTGS